MATRFGTIAVLLAIVAVSAIAQQLPDVNSLQELPSTTPPSPRYQRLHPFSIHPRADFLNSETSPVLAPNAQAVGFSLTGVNSVPNFQGSFSSRGKTWPFTMIG